MPKTVPLLNYQEYLDIKDKLLDLYSYEDDILSELNLKNISLLELEENCFYIGECRNADLAFWDGKEFHYIRTGWTKDDRYIQSINHIEKETHECADIFLPFAQLTSISIDLNNFFVKNNFISN